MTKTIRIGDRRVQYTLERKSVKNMNMRVRPDGTIYISANASVTVEQAEAFMLKHAEFILHAIDRTNSRTRPSALTAKCVEGETVTLFGRQLTLHIVRGTRNGVTQGEGGSVKVTVRDPDDDMLRRRTLVSWLYRCFREAVLPICERMYAAFSPYGKPYPRIRFRQMRSCWGNCNNSTNTVTFSYALLSADLACIEYVVAHEFCHFIHSDHSQAFWNRLAVVIPDWHDRRKRLNATCTTY